MPGSGSFIIKPIEAHFTDANVDFDHLSSYCDLYLGAKHAKTEICEHGGSNPSWHHPLVIPIKDDHAKCTIEVVGEQFVDEVKETAGCCDINLEEIKTAGNLRKWYTLTRDGVCGGDILIESSFLPELPPFFGTKSAPSTEASLNEGEQVKEKKFREDMERKSVRKFSDNKQDRPGRGWNLYVPGEDLEPNLNDLDDLVLKKTRSAMPNMEGEGQFVAGKIQRRKSFWESLLNI